MSWWDDAFTVAADFGKSAMDFAKENPALAGAGAGLAVHHLTGGKGEDNLGAALGGAALGAGANYLFGNQAAAVPVSSAPTVGTGSAPTMAAPTPAGPISSAATMGTGATAASSGPQELGEAGGYSVGGNSGVTGDTGGTMMSQAGAGLQKLRKFGGENEAVLSGMSKVVGAYLGNKSRAAAAAPVQAYNEQYRAKADEAQAANTQLVGQNNANIAKQNAIMDQLSADTAAIDPQRAGVQAYTTGLSRTADQAKRVAEAETGKGYSAATVAANKRRGTVGATTAATTAAEAARTGAQSRRSAGLGAVKYGAYQQQAVPSYDTGYASGVQTANAGSGSDTAGAIGLFEDVFGLEKDKAKTQVGA
jgi:hypothetical protein